MNKQSVVSHRVSAVRCLMDCTNPAQCGMILRRQMDSIVGKSELPLIVSVAMQLQGKI